MCPKLLSYFSDCKQNNVAFSLFTNGISITPQTIDCCDEYYLSIDGVGQIHDSVRNMNGAYEKVKNLLQIMKNQDKKIHIQTTISKINIDHLKQVIELYVDLIPQLKSISLVATVNQGNTFNNGISLAKSELIKIKEFKEEYNMTQQDAKKVLWLLAQRSSDFERLAAEYLPLLMPDAELPDTLPGQVLDTLRSDPEMARAIDNVNLSVNLGELAGKAENYSITDLATPELIIAILVLLSMSFKLKYRNGSWSFDFGYKSPDIKALTQILQILANAVTDKLGKGLAELSESLSDSEKETKETDS